MPNAIVKTNCLDKSTKKQCNCKILPLKVQTQKEDCLYLKTISSHGTVVTVVNTYVFYNYYLIQNSQAAKKVCGPQKGYGEKRCEIQGGGQEMAVMVG